MWKRQVLSIVVFIAIIAFGQVNADSGFPFTQIWESADIGAVGPVIVEDIDNDGINEIVVGAGKWYVPGSNGNIYVFNSLTHELEWKSNSINTVTNLEVIDLNNDNKKEIIAKVFAPVTDPIGVRYGYVYVFDGTTHKQIWQSDNIGGHGGNLVIADIDNNGIKDIIVASANYYSCTIHGYVYVFDGASFAKKWQSIDINAPQSFQVTDVDNDGVKEVIIGSMVNDCTYSYFPGYVYVFNGLNGNLKWKSPDIGTSYPVVDDVDNDGVKEIITGVMRNWPTPATEPSSGYVYVFNGITHIQEWKSMNINTCRGIKVDDSDSDGDREIIVRTYKANEGYLYVFNGKTYNQEWKSENLANDGSMYIDDIDKDGIKEILDASGNSVKAFNANTYEKELIIENATNVLFWDLDKDGWKELIKILNPDSNHGYLSLWTNTSKPINHQPNQPVNVFPVNGAKDVPLTTPFEFSAFSDPDPGDFHSTTEWEITTIPGDYSVFPSVLITAPATSLEQSLISLEYGVTYYWHVRYDDNHSTYSEWSEETSFTTIADNHPPQRPDNKIPNNKATNVSLTTTFESSPFSDPDPGDTHAASRWQFTTVQGDYNSPLYDSGEFPADSEVGSNVVLPLSPAFLEYGKTYYWRVMYKDNHGAWSDWSVETSFRTVTKFNFVHITDVHIGSNKWTRWKEVNSYLNFGDTLISIAKRVTPKPSFMIITGDNVEYSKKEWFEVFHSFTNIFNSRGVPVYILPGNHDRYTGELSPLAELFWGGDDYLYNYHKYSGGTDMFSFEYQSYLFIGLDSGADFKDDLEIPDLWDIGPEAEGLNGFQVDYLKSMDKNTPKILFMHHPFYTGNEDPTFYLNEDFLYKFVIEDGSFAFYRDDFFDFCQDNNVLLGLCGHTHESHTFNKTGDEVQTMGTDHPYFIQTPSATKDQDQFKHGYRVVKVEDNVLSTEYIQTEFQPKQVISSTGPINLNAYDAQGNHTGYGSVIVDIPDSYYTGYYSPLTPQMIILYNTQSDYKYELTAIDEGNYILDIAFMKNESEIINFKAVDIPVLPGEHHRYNIDWNILSDEKGVTVQKDVNGDGIFEETINTGSIYTPKQIFTINLNKGWNLVSVCLDVTDTGIWSVLEPIEGLYGSVWTYEGNIGWKKYIYENVGSASDLNTIEPEKGYLIFMNEPAKLWITGDELIEQSIQLRQGWNLVGYNFLTAQPVENTTLSLPNGTCIYTYDSDAGVWLHCVVGGSAVPNNLDKLIPGKGYWIYVAQDCVWTVNPNH